MTRSAAVTAGVGDVHQRQRTVDDASGFKEGAEEVTELDLSGMTHS